MEDRSQASAGPFDEETPRRAAVRTFGAVGAALWGALGLGAMSAATNETQNRTPVGSERKAKRRKRDKTYWARVASDGTLIAGQGFVRSRRLKLAEYVLSTDGTESFAECALSGMAEQFKVVHFGSTGDGTIGVHLREFVNNEPPDPPVYLDVDGEFSLVVICPAT